MKTENVINNIHTQTEQCKGCNKGKACGLDGVTADMLKLEVVMTPTLLRSILERIWNSEETPESWTTGLIVKLSKERGHIGLQQLARHHPTVYH